MDDRYTIKYLNFGWDSSTRPKTLEEAKKVARASGFQSAIVDPSGQTVLTYCPMAGFVDCNGHKLGRTS